MTFLESEKKMIHSSPSIKPNISPDPEKGSMKLDKLSIVQRKTLLKINK